MFGHSSIRIVDKKNNLDEIFNFGMFDIETPNFILKFLKGKLKYNLGIQNTKDFIDIYTHENRLITEQKLNLTTEEKLKIITQLHFLHEPENKYYYYSFLNKNCATELRNLFDLIDVKFRDAKIDVTYRELISSYLVKRPWLKLGVNLISGKHFDEKPTSYQSMFLPDFLYKEVSLARINGTNLVKDEKSLNSIITNNRENFKIIFSPFVFLSIFVLLLFFWFPNWLKLLVSSTIGLTGLFILGTWIFSNHQELKYNLNMLWCNPFYLLYLPGLLNNHQKKVLNLFLRATLFVSLLIWTLKIQNFDVGVIPIFLILGLINIFPKTSGRSFIIQKYFTYQDKT